MLMLLEFSDLKVFMKERFEDINKKAFKSGRRGTQNPRKFNCSYSISCKTRVNGSLYNRRCCSGEYGRCLQCSD